MDKRIAVVTGASSGIGKSTVEKLLEDGFVVVGFARRADRLNEITGEHFHAVVGDVTNKSDVNNLVDEVKDRYGKIDVLVNNAGVGYLGRMDETRLEEWDKMIDINLKGLLSVTHAFLPMLVENRAHLINVDSVAGHEVYPDGVVYCSTKHAVRVISIGLEKELKGKVKITNVSLIELNAL